MRIIVYIAAVLFFIALGVQLINLYRQNIELKADVNDLVAQVETLKEENKQLQDDIEYFSDPENLAKELKARFDYKRPGETLIKIQ